MYAFNNLILIYRFIFYINIYLLLKKVLLTSPVLTVHPMSSDFAGKKIISLHQTFIFLLGRPSAVPTCLLTLIILVLHLLRLNNFSLSSVSIPNSCRLDAVGSVLCVSCLALSLCQGGAFQMLGCWMIKKSVLVQVAVRLAPLSIFH